MTRLNCLSLLSPWCLRETVFLLCCFSQPSETVHIKSFTIKWCCNTHWETRFASVKVLRQGSQTGQDMVMIQLAYDMSLFLVSDETWHINSMFIMGWYDTMMNLHAVSFITIFTLVIGYVSFREEANIKIVKFVWLERSWLYTKRQHWSSVG